MDTAASIIGFCFGFKLELVGLQQLSAETLPFCVSMRTEAHIARFWLRQHRVSNVVKRGLWG